MQKQKQNQKMSKFSAKGPITSREQHEFRVLGRLRLPVTYF
jgi:hypothetical protein